MKKYIRNKSLTNIKDLKLGKCIIYGKSKMKSFVMTHFSKIKCLYCKWFVESESFFGSNGNIVFSKIAKGEVGELFYLEDESGEVLLNPQNYLV